MPYAYGSSYDAVAQADANNRAAQAQQGNASLNRLLGVLQNVREQQRQNREFEFRKQEAEDKDAMEKAHLAIGLRAQDAAELAGRNHYDFQNRQLAQEKAIADQNAEIARLHWGAVNQKNDPHYNTALSMLQDAASKGIDISSQFKGIVPDVELVSFAHAAAVAKDAINAKHTDAQNMADQFNREEIARRRLNELSTALTKSKERNHLWYGNQESENITKLTNDLAEAQRQVDRFSEINKLPRALNEKAGLVGIDARGKYVATTRAAPPSPTFSAPQSQPGFQFGPTGTGLIPQGNDQAPAIPGVTPYQGNDFSEPADQGGQTGTFSFAPPSSAVTIAPEQPAYIRAPIVSPGADPAYSFSGATPVDTGYSGAGGDFSSAPSSPVRVSNPNDVLRLPPGTQFIDPNGVIRVRP